VMEYEETEREGRDERGIAHFLKWLTRHCHPLTDVFDGIVGRSLCSFHHDCVKGNVLWSVFEKKLRFE